MMVWKMKIPFQLGGFLGSMLIFRGVHPGKTSQEKNNNFQMYLLSNILIFQSAMLAYWKITFPTKNIYMSSPKRSMTQNEEMFYLRSSTT